MRILWLTEDFPGIKKFLTGEVDYDQGMPAQYNPLIYMASKGHFIDIISPGHKYQLKKELRKNITSTIYIKPNENSIFNIGVREFRVSFIINIIKSLIMSINLYKTNDYDIIYSHWEFQSVVGRIISIMKGKPQVTRMYGSMLYGRTNGNLSYMNILLNFNRYIPFILNFKAMILTQDGTGGEIIHKKVRGNNDKLVLLLNGTDKSNVKGDYKNKYKFLNGRFIISYIGRVEGWKRTYLFSDTLNEVSKKIPNVCYLIVGTGVDLVKEKKKIDSNGLDEFIHFTGRVSQDERKYLMNLSDIYVSMYNYSNLSNTFLESISAGIPTLIIPNGNTKKIAKNGINCLFVDEDDPKKSLIKKILYLYTNENKRVLLGLNAKKFARDNILSWRQRSKIEAQIIEGIYNKYKSKSV